MEPVNCHVKLTVDTSELEAATARMRAPRWPTFVLLAWRITVMALLVGLAIATCGCPRARPAAAPAAVPEVLGAGDLAVQMACAVTGSAVALDARHVITAAHVIAQCPDALLVVYVDGEPRAATIEIVDFRGDTARLLLSAGSVDFTAPPPALAPAQPGERVCLRSGNHRTVRCGVVSSVATGRGGLQHTAPTQKGDSGAGLYDTQGRLVGIVVTCDVTEAGVCLATGGGATPAASIGWAVAP